MRASRELASGLMILTVLAGCQPAEPPAPAAPVIEEIPVTTSSPEALADFERGRELLDVGRGQEANALFEAAAAKDPSFAFAYLNIAITAASLQEFSDSHRLATANLEGKSEGERLLAEILQTIFDNDAEKRIELARLLVEQYPRSPRAWLVLARTQGDLNQHQAARESMRQALELDPAFKAAHVVVWASYLFREPKDFARSEQAMLACLELDPDEAKLHENLGDVYRAMQQLERAGEMYTRAAEIDPSHSAVHIKKGHVNSFLGNFEQARAAYDAGVAGAKEQNRITYANYRSFTHLHAGDPRGALDELAGLLATADEVGIPEEQVFGAKIFTLTNQATIALHHGFFTAAKNILTELATVVRANIESVDAPELARQQEANLLLWQSRLAARTGDYEGALTIVEDHRKLLENDNNPRRFEGYYGLLGLVELLRGNSSQAVLQLGKSDLNSMYVKYHLALAEEGAGNAEEARRLFKEVAEWNFNSVGFALVRKDALARMG